MCFQFVWGVSSEATEPRAKDADSLCNLSQLLSRYDCDMRNIVVLLVRPSPSVSGAGGALMTDSLLIAAYLVV